MQSELSACVHARPVEVGATRTGAILYTLTSRESQEQTPNQTTILGIWRISEQLCFSSLSPHALANDLAYLRLTVYPVMTLDVQLRTPLALPGCPRLPLSHNAPVCVQGILRL